MSRVSKISRQADDYEFERPDNLPSWLSNFAKSIAKKPTAVDSARERNAQSVNQMVNSILGNKPVYSSVEDAVNDMRERTGLDAYLKQIKADKSVSKIASDNSEPHISFDGGETFIAVNNLNKEELLKNIDEAFNKSDSDLHDEAIDMVGSGTIDNADDKLSWLKNYCELYEKRYGRPYILGMTSANKFNNLGRYDGIRDLENHGFGSDILAGLLAYKETSVKIPLNEYINYANGYIKGAEISDEHADFELDKIHSYLSKHNYKKANALPEPLAKYDSVAQDIDNFVNNTIKNSHGIGSTVPQLQYDILANFGRAGVDSKDVMNDQVVKYLSDCILEAQKNIAPKSPEPNLGRGIGRAEEDNNNDAWSGLMPQKKF